MMTFASMVKAVAITGVLMIGGTAFGQQVGRPPASSIGRPTTSPYLNLLNPQNSFEFNYFQRVRPEQTFRQAHMREYRAISGLQRRQRELVEEQQMPTSQLGPTGHTARFHDLGTYFPAARGRN